MVGLQSGSDQRIQGGIWSRDRSDIKTVFYHFVYQQIARIRDQRIAGIGYQSDIVPFLKQLDDAFGRFFLIEIVIGDHPGMDVKMTQQFDRITRIFTGDHVDIS